MFSRWRRQKSIDGLFRKVFFPRGMASEIGRLLASACCRKWSTLTSLEAFSFWKSARPLPDELLMYADKLSMAHSLEVRVPYLDRTVVEYVQRLGANLKVRNGTRKWLHRQVCQSYLPPQILKRKKRGFAVNVVDEWFHSSLNGALQEMLLDESSLMFGLLNPNRYEGCSKVTNPAARTTTSSCLAW